MTHPTDSPAPWWRSAVVYQVYPRSFADHDGDGVGDVQGMIDRLPYLAELGIDAVWVSPWYPSPMADGGYDVSDYRDIHPDFGTLEHAGVFITKAHELGLRVLIDLVPNHSSDAHPWFQAAQAAPKGSPERELYIFRDGVGEDGDLPPNNWPAMFGGGAWERTTDPDGRPGQWYLHLFAPEQPDWNWDNPAVVEEFDAILRFWFDRGVDGFRIDVANSMAKAPGLPDLDVDAEGQPIVTTLTGTPYLNQPHIHDIFRRWRTVADAYAGTEQGARVFVSEAYVTPASELASYIRPDELHTTFNFDALLCEWTASSQRSVIDLTLAATGEVGAPATWVLANHDMTRVVTRYGRPVTGARFTPSWYRRRAPERHLAEGARPDRRRAGAEAGPSRCAAGAGPTRRSVRLPRRRTRAGGGRGSPGGAAAGSDLGTLRPHRARPRRLPGADPVVRQRAAVRVRIDGASAVAATARPLGRSDRRGAGRRPGEHADPLPHGPGRAATEPGPG